MMPDSLGDFQVHSYGGKFSERDKNSRFCDNARLGRCRPSSIDVLLAVRLYLANIKRRDFCRTDSSESIRQVVPGFQMEAAYSSFDWANVL